MVCVGGGCAGVGLVVVEPVICAGGVEWWAVVAVELVVMAGWWP